MGGQRLKIREPRTDAEIKCRLAADAFQFDLAHGFAAAETILGIEDFQAS
jgi:hypothetical protein